MFAGENGNGKPCSIINEQKYLFTTIGSFVILCKHGGIAPWCETERLNFVKCLTICIFIPCSLYLTLYRTRNGVSDRIELITCKHISRTPNKNTHHTSYMFASSVLCTLCSCVCVMCNISGKHVVHRHTLISHIAFQLNASSLWLFSKMYMLALLRFYFITIPRIGKADKTKIEYSRRRYEKKRQKNKEINNFFVYMPLCTLFWSVVSFSSPSSTVAWMTYSSKNTKQ